MRHDEAFALLKRHADVSHETFHRLNLYAELLIKWQAKVNLVGPDTIGDLWSRHFLDSLQLLPHIPDLKSSMIDMGTGAGFPGMALAIAGASDIHLIESDHKKIIFLREVARLTETKISIHHGRVEDKPIESATIILSRALGNLDTLCRYSSLYVSHETICLFHKGKNYITELEDAKTNWMFDCSTSESVTDPQGAILKLTNLRNRGYDKSNKQGQRT